jgi:23S rRNA (cytosine1962-C5)-methyltransferase
LWVFSNEVDTRRTPLKEFEPGQAANLVDSQGKPLGTALVNPHSLICARLISRRPDRVPSQAWLARRLSQALSFLEALYSAPNYRWFYGESDGLPGLVLDRIGDVVVGQLNTAGTDRLRADIEAAIEAVVSPKAILWRNDSPVRELEGLARVVESGPGELPDEVTVVEGKLQFCFNLTGGQKTGWYFDQQANRTRVLPLLAGAERVLDLYAYHGAWGIGAAAAGVGEVHCVDSSAPAVAVIAANAERNELADRVRAVHQDAEKYMDELLVGKERFDAVIVDPPAFAPRARDVKPALKAYRRVNEKAMRLVRQGGLLISCSCSAHVHESRFADMLRQAARHIDRELQVLMRLEQGPDHPVHPAIPETRYLKGLVTRVLPSF